MEGGVFRRGGLLTVFVLGVLVRASAHAAQTVGAATGAIDGTVTDRTGAVLRAVTIDVSGDALMGTRTEVTGPDGSYRFPALPPGEYALVFKLEGFQPASRSVRVTFGFTTTVNIPMDVAAHQVDLNVDGGVRVVDRHTTMIATNFDRRDLALFAWVAQHELDSRRHAVHSAHPVRRRRQRCARSRPVQRVWHQRL